MFINSDVESHLNTVVVVPSHEQCVQPKSTWNRTQSCRQKRQETFDNLMIALMSAGH